MIFGVMQQIILKCHIIFCWCRCFWQICVTLLLRYNANASQATQLKCWAPILLIDITHLNTTVKQCSKVRNQIMSVLFFNCWMLVIKLPIFDTLDFRCCSFKADNLLWQSSASTLVLYFGNKELILVGTVAVSLVKDSRTIEWRQPAEVFVFAYILYYEFSCCYCCCV